MTFIFFSKMFLKNILKIFLNLCFACGVGWTYTYGRRMTTSLLQSRGYRIGERTVRSALMRTTPFYQAQRKRGTERLRNPTPYYAKYAGHKLPLDQNEKLAEFGLTHVFASDGYSGKIDGASSMPVKNNVIIYDEVYRYVKELARCLRYFFNSYFFVLLNSFLIT